MKACPPRDVWNRFLQTSSSPWLLIFSILATTASGRILVFLPSESSVHLTWQQLIEARPLGFDLANSGNIRISQVHHNSPDFPQDHSLIPPASQREVLLATEASESSMRLCNIRYVVDSGRIKASADSPDSSLSEEVMIDAATSSFRRSLAAHRDGGHYYACFSKERLGSPVSLVPPKPDKPGLLQLCVPNPSSVDLLKLMQRSWLCWEP